MMCRIAPASLAILAVFNVASTLASPVTVSSAWAQHARSLPQNPLACIAAPRPTQCLGRRAVLTYSKTPSHRARPPPHRAILLRPNCLDSYKIAR